MKTHHIDIASRLLLPSLHTLKIEGDVLSPFIRAISAPALQNLDVLAEQMLGTLKSFLGNKPPLQRLSLRGNGTLNSEKFISFLSGLAELRSLHLEGWKVNKAILQALSPAPLSSPSSWVCPRISALWIDLCDMDGDSLVNFIRLRAGDMGEKKSLSRVDLHAGRRLSDEHAAALAEISERGYSMVIVVPKEGALGSACEGLHLRTCFLFAAHKCDNQNVESFTGRKHWRSLTWISLGDCFE